PSGFLGRLCQAFQSLTERAGDPVVGGPGGDGPGQKAHSRRDHRKKPSCHDFPCGHVKYPRSGRRPPVVGWRGWVRKDRRAVGGACRLPGCRAALIGGKAERKAHGGNGGSHTSAPCPASAPHTAPTIVRSVPGGVARILG